MKLPNGYGSITKLKGKRRKPWRVRKTIGWEWNEEKQKAVQICPTIGYYATKTEALQALADYNADPYDLKHNTITFAEIYERWSEKHFEKVSESGVKGYKASYKICQKLWDMKFVEIKLEHLQACVDESGKNTPTLRKLKVLWGLLFDYAAMYEIISADKKEMVRYVDISGAGNPDSRNATPFTAEQRDTIWRWKDSNHYFEIVLMLIYTGVRISELLNLKKENVNLEEHWFDVTASKTQAGVRRVPIADKVYPFFQKWYNSSGDCEYLVYTTDQRHLTYANYIDSYWTPLMDQAGMKHRPHDTRHTCISMLTVAGVDERIIKKIVGHKGQGVTQIVYTHFEIAELLDAINKI